MGKKSLLVLLVLSRTRLINIKMSETPPPVKIDPTKLEFRNYESDAHLDIIMAMIGKELSEPYPILTYRYFV